MPDIAIVLDRLIPAAEYSGSLTGNTEADYDAIVWTDARTKPTWAEIEDEWEAYEGEQALLKPYQIYDYVPGFTGDPTIHPGPIDFITGLDRRLLPKHTFSYGELQSTIYYEQRVEGVYSIPVIKETFTYTRDATTGFPLYRTNHIQWYYTDGTLEEDGKLLEKYYDDDPIMQLNELARRRDNNIKNIIGSIIGLALATEPEADPNEVLDQGRAFFNNSAMNRELYIEDGNMALVDDVRNDATITWFDNDVTSLVGLATIRSFIIYQLTMGAETS